MKDSDYEPLDKRQRSRTWHSAILRIVAIIGAAPVVLFLAYWSMMQWNNFELERRTSESKIIGRTPSQVISLLGPPSYRDRQTWEPVGTEIMIYQNGGSRICRINFEGGIAKTIQRLSDH